MQLIYTLEELPEKITKSLFLAGCSARTKEVESYRKDAIKILEDIGFDGAVFIPEMRDPKDAGKYETNYEEAVDWEDKCLNVADVIVFYVNRDLSLDSRGKPKLPGFTTNIEWGTWQSSGKVVLGYPKNAAKMDYMEVYAKKLNIPVTYNLTETIHNALDMIGEGVERTKGERYVPLNIWKLASFQQWYKAQINAGNSLEYAKVLYTFRPGNKDFTFLWILKADVYIASEDRVKSNEFVLSRPDISSVVLWKKADPIDQSEVVLIKEFRTPAATTDGFIRELIGGSAKKDASPVGTALEEVLEESGMVLEGDRLKEIGTRQICGTLSAHKCHLFSYKLNDKELEWLKSQKDVVHGNKEDSERTFIEIYTLADLKKNDLTDWSNLGAIFQVVLNG